MFLKMRIIMIRTQSYGLNKYDQKTHMCCFVVVVVYWKTFVCF